MKIRVLVKPNSKKGPLIAEKSNDLGSYLEIRVKAQPIEGKANQELIKIIAERYKIAKNKVKILKGDSSRFKIIEINV